MPRTNRGLPKHVYPVKDRYGNIRFYLRRWVKPRMGPDATVAQRRENFVRLSRRLPPPPTSVRSERVDVGGVRSYRLGRHPEADVPVGERLALFALRRSLLWPRLRNRRRFLFARTEVRDDPRDDENDRRER